MSGPCRVRAGSSLCGVACRARRSLSLSLFLYLYHSCALSLSFSLSLSLPPLSLHSTERNPASHLPVGRMRVPGQQNRETGRRASRVPGRRPAQLRWPGGGTGRRNPPARSRKTLLRVPRFIRINSRPWPADPGHARRVTLARNRPRAPCSGAGAAGAGATHPTMAARPGCRQSGRSSLGGISESPSGREARAGRANETDGRIDTAADGGGRVGPERQ